jgi:hypothetical protein
VNILRNPGPCWFEEGYIQPIRAWEGVTSHVLKDIIEFPDMQGGIGEVVW